MKILIEPNSYSQQRQQDKARWIYPVVLAMYATYMRNQGHQVWWEKPKDMQYLKFDKVIDSEDKIDVPFIELPPADRLFTKAFDKKYQTNGNFKYHPGTYIQSSLDCHWHLCKFCSWATKFPNYQLRTVDQMIEEIESCVAMGFREIFDDSGTFPMKEKIWLVDFCLNMITKKLNKKVKISCNLRADWENIVYFKLMKKAGFRMILIGLESFNQRTLDMLGKGTNANTYFVFLKQLIEVGLEPHIAVMFGYPWETEKEELYTLRMTQECLKKGLARTAQASVFTAYEGTPIAEEYPISKNGCNLKNEIYKVGYSPQFWFNQLRHIRNWADIKYIIKGIKAALLTLLLICLPLSAIAKDARTCIDKYKLLYAIARTECGRRDYELGIEDHRAKGLSKQLGWALYEIESNWAEYNRCPNAKIDFIDFLSSDYCPANRAKWAENVRYWYNHK